MILPPMHLIADGGEHALGRAADAPQQVDRRALRDRDQRRRHVAVRDEADARARLADLLDRLGVARAVEHDHHHVADRRALLLGDQLERLAERAVEVEQVGQVLRGGHLVHVDARARVEHRAALGRARSRPASSAGRWRTARCPRAGRRRCPPAAASRRRSARRCRASAPRPSRPRRSPRRRPCARCRASAAWRPRRRRRPTPSRRGRSSARRRARRTRWSGPARARGCGRAGRRRRRASRHLDDARGLAALGVARLAQEAAERHARGRRAARRSSRSSARSRRSAPGRPRMIPLQRISTKAVMPTIIVTSPGFQVSLCPRATIQARMNGAGAAATSSQSRMPKVSNALTESPARCRRRRSSEFGFGRWCRTTAGTARAPAPRRRCSPPSSPGVSRLVSR